MALTKIKRHRLNSSMTPQAQRVFNRCIERVINAIDSAANEIADYGEASYIAFMEELEGAINYTLQERMTYPGDYEYDED